MFYTLKIFAFCTHPVLPSSFEKAMKISFCKIMCLEVYLCVSMYVGVLGGQERSSGYKSAGVGAGYQSDSSEE